MTYVIPCTTTVAAKDAFVRYPSPLSVAEHGPYRVDGDEHPFRAIFEALEAQPTIELHAAREDLVSAVLDHIQHNQLEADFPSDAAGAAKRVDCEIRPEPLALPDAVDGNHGEKERRNTADPGRSPGTVRPEIICRDRMGVHRIVSENLGHPFRDRDKDPCDVVLLLSLGAEPQKVVEANGSAGDTRPVMPTGIEWLNYDLRFR